MFRIAGYLEAIVQSCPKFDYIATEAGKLGKLGDVSPRLQIVADTVCTLFRLGSNSRNVPRFPTGEATTLVISRLTF